MADFKDNREGDAAAMTPLRKPWTTPRVITSMQLRDSELKSRAFPDSHSLSADFGS